MAEVFLAREPLAGGLAKILVIKKIHPGLAMAEQFRQMFEDEAKIGVALNHPNIVQTFGYGQLGHTFFLAMERVEGVDLLRLIHAAAAAGRRVPPGLAAYVIQQVAKGLDYAHRRADDFGEPLHIVHRDVSPQNILVSFDGAVKLVDFGIARVRGQKNDHGQVKGKFAYMSPEQAEGLPADRRSDVFSAGIVLYELATGRALFGRLGERQALDAIRSALVPRPRDTDPEMPEELERIVLRALSRRPDERFQTARDLHNALGKFFFHLGSQEGALYESGSLAAFIAQVIPIEERQRVRALEDVADLNSGSAAQRPFAGGDDPTDELENTTARGRAEAVPASAPTLAVTDGGDSLLVGGPRERKSVVMVAGVFTGFGALRRQLGAEKARGVLLDFLRVAEHVAYKHRAHPDHVDDRGFSYLVGLPVSCEDDPARAVQLALALGEALEGIARDSRPPLQLSIGAEAGVALVRRSLVPRDSRFEHELTGAVASIARRLAEEAMPGELLVGGDLHRAARGEWRFEELPALELTHEGEPGELRPEPRSLEGAGRTRVFRLLGPQPRTERMAPTAGAALWGRELELQALLDAEREVTTHGAGRYLVVVGDRGVGKRSLVAAFCAGLDPATHLTLRAVASLTRSDTPYGLAADLARDLLGVGDDVEPRDLKRRIDTAVAALFGNGDSRRARLVVEALMLLFDLNLPGADEIDATERRHRIYQALRWVGDRLSRERSLVLVLEDLHFADRQSFELFHALARDPLPRPVLAIATARREGARPQLSDGDSIDPFDSDLPIEMRLETLLTVPSVIPIFVGELPPRAREALLDARFDRSSGGGGDDDIETLGRAILDRAGGNPLYINEIIESLTERGILVPGRRVEGRPTKLALARRAAEVAVPLSIEAAVGSRIDRLPDEERAALRAASVLGRTFRIGDLAALLPAGDVAKRLDLLVQRGLVEPIAGGAHAFRNAITQEVAYGALAPEARADLHRRAAERLGAGPRYRRGADDARIAQHLEAAGDHLGSSRASSRAGAHARDVSGNVEAWRHFTQALRLLSDEPATRAERFDLHAEREPILRAWGRRADQEREIAALRRLADETGDPRRLARALGRLAAFHLDGGRHAAGRREIARTLEIARAIADPIAEAEALRLEATVLLHIGSYPEALSLARAALLSLGTLDDRAALLERAEALNAVGCIELHQGRADAAARAHGEALAIYRGLGSRRREAMTENHLGRASLALGDYQAALERFNRSHSLGREIGDRRGIGAALGNLGATWARLGDLDRAASHLGRALELDEISGDMAGLTGATLTLGQVQLRRGDLRAAAELLERGLELAQSMRDRYQEIRALGYLALCQIEAGGTTAPIDLARSAVKLAREAGIPNGIASGLSAEAAALGRLGRNHEAAEKSSEALAVLDEGASIDEREEILRRHSLHLAAAGRADEAEVAIARAVAEVHAKADRLGDPALRELYLGAPPASEILALAHAADSNFPRDLK